MKASQTTDPCTRLLAGIVVIIGLTLPVFLSAQTSPAKTSSSKQPVSKLVKSGYAPVNGLKLYYEIYGQGQPLVLLHGGLGAIEMFGSVLQTLAENHQVIAVDLQAHGRTADIDRPMSCELMADDIGGLLKHLGIAKADVMGYSLGAGVALWTALKYPEAVRKLVVVSLAIKRQAQFPEILAAQEQMGPEVAEVMKRTPMYQMYASLAPRPEDWQKLIVKIGKTVSTNYDWTNDVKTLKTPTLIICADGDLFPPSHAVEFYGLLGGGQKDAGWDGSGHPAAQLAILPGQSHYDIFMSPKLAPTAIAYLDTPDKK